MAVLIAVVSYVVDICGKMSSWAWQYRMSFNPDLGLETVVEAQHCYQNLVSDPELLLVYAMAWLNI